MLTSPLEQFEILSLIKLKIFILDFSITNLLVINVLTLLTFQSFIYYSSSYNNYSQENSVYFTNAWENFLDSISEITTQLISDTITTNNEKYFPVISVLFNFI